MRPSLWRSSMAAYDAATDASGSLSDTRPPLLVYILESILIGPLQDSDFLWIKASFCRIVDGTGKSSGDIWVKWLPQNTCVLLSIDLCINN
jgi:hypothetical protein